MESDKNQKTGGDVDPAAVSKNLEIEEQTEETERQSGKEATSTGIEGESQTLDESEPVQEVIDDLSKQLVDNLLKPKEITSEKKYVTMQEQMETKEKEKQSELARKLQSQAQVSVAGVHKVLKPPAIETNHSNEDNANTTESDAFDLSILTNGGSQTSSEAQLSLPGNTINGHTSADTLDVSMLMERNTIADHQSHSMNLWNDDVQGDSDSKNVEVDILTAVSEGGMCNIQSLPHVLDGLSDGEITPDSEDENSGGILEELNQTVMDKSRLRSTLSHHIEDDPFYKNHEKIMSRIDREQIKDINNVLTDIVKQTTTGRNNESLMNEGTEVTSPIWHIRDSYSESLKKQEDKRQRRIELEKQYELEYRQQHLTELEELEKRAEVKVPIGQALEEETEEPAAAANNTDYVYSSDEDPAENDDRTSSFGWMAGRQNYTPLTANNEHVEGSPGPRSSGRSQRVGQISNACRLADHERCSSPTQNTHTKGADRLSSNGSLNSYSSSSQSSNFTPSTVVRRKPGDSIDSSSSESWDSADQTPVTFGPKKKKISPKKKLAEKTPGDKEFDTDEETDQLLNKNYNKEVKVEIPENRDKEIIEQAMKNKAKEVTVYDPDEPTVLIEGILFRAAYLGSTQLVSEAQPSKAMRMMQAQEAVGRIKVSEGEHQPSTDVDLFVSTEKVMVLNTDLKEIMMDHALRSISYIADIDNILVLMAKRSLETSRNKEHKLICHIFETDEAHLIAQSIGQAFQVAYIEFLKANGIEEPVDLLRDTSYEDILEQQEIMNDELEMFTRKDMQKDVVVPKSRNEILGVVIVESGWGSVLPTVILANMSPTGAAARCGLLNIGDQIMSVNGISLVGLPLSTCQEHIRAVRNLTAVRLCVVSRTPVIEVLIRRPDKKYQLGFSVQNGVICSLLRGGIAERGGVRVGHRIIEINGQSVVAVTHDKIVHMLSTSVGEIHMKTMPMAVFKLLTGQEVPQYI